MWSAKPQPLECHLEQCPLPRPHRSLQISSTRPSLHLACSPTALPDFQITPFKLGVQNVVQKAPPSPPEHFPCLSARLARPCPSPHFDSGLSRLSRNQRHRAEVQPTTLLKIREFLKIPIKSSFSDVSSTRSSLIYISLLFPCALDISSLLADLGLL